MNKVKKSFTGCPDDFFFAMQVIGKKNFDEKMKKGWPKYQSFILGFFYLVYAKRTSLIPKIMTNVKC